MRNCGAAKKERQFATQSTTISRAPPIFLFLVCGWRMYAARSKILQRWSPDIQDVLDCLHHVPCHVGAEDCFGDATDQLISALAEMLGKQQDWSLFGTLPWALRPQL